ncbi:MAG TPA: hypothetical protein VFZ12_03415 [Dehalococcoidia bacterium]|nr:hypothetical protein [Dehalococcoidia bacterium]
MAVEFLLASISGFAGLLALDILKLYDNRLRAKRAEAQAPVTRRKPRTHPTWSERSDTDRRAA